MIILQSFWKQEHHVFLTNVCLQEVTAPSSAAAVDTSPVAAAESEPDEPKDTEPEDTVGLAQLFLYTAQKN